MFDEYRENKYIDGNELLEDLENISNRLRWRGSNSTNYVRAGYIEDSKAENILNIYDAWLNILFYSNFDLLDSEIILENIVLDEYLTNNFITALEQNKNILMVYESYNDYWMFFNIFNKYIENEKFKFINFISPGFLLAHHCRSVNSDTRVFGDFYDTLEKIIPYKEKTILNFQNIDHVMLYGINSNEENGINLNESAKILLLNFHKNIITICGMKTGLYNNYANLIQNNNKNELYTHKISKLKYNKELWKQIFITKLGFLNFKLSNEQLDNFVGIFTNFLYEIYFDNIVSYLKHNNESINNIDDFWKCIYSFTQNYLNIIEPQKNMNLHISNDDAFNNTFSSLIENETNYYCLLNKKPRSLFIIDAYDNINDESLKQINDELYKENNFFIFNFKKISSEFIFSSNLNDTASFINAVKQNANALCVFKNIQKCSKNTLLKLMRVVDEGVVTDNFGNEFNCKLAKIIVIDTDWNISNAFKLSQNSDIKSFLSLFYPIEFINRFNQILFLDNELIKRNNSSLEHLKKDLEHYVKNILNKELTIRFANSYQIKDIYELEMNIINNITSNLKEETNSILVAIKDNTFEVKYD
ncbi:hypothetical protein [Mycoplasmopsis verecunda]|uniref:Uncharacterized protein n=1 Tax=Mycoplasmopsis verecunda TaxID=171291 RepID=A0A1T4LUP3_9BACT|nr:hypothetical protein [Mycoplasmopsis verecunda]WPB54521.1 hypothetical protein SAM46_03550 [Mycoplasmopsis verecunda]SJZ58459.1 hypothetical protein SAMN02745154_00546 [Mycoplasmopsis verecunda]